MGTSMHVVGFHPVDDKYRKMKAVWSACTAAGIEVPEEVRLFFDDRSPSESAEGVRVEMDGLLGVSMGTGGVEIDLRMIPPHIKIIRVLNTLQEAP